MASTARAATAVFPPPSPGQQEQVEHLLQLQKAAKKINSILDLEALIDTIVNDVVCKFGCEGREPVNRLPIFAASPASGRSEVKRTLSPQMW